METLYPRSALHLNARLTYTKKRALETPDLKHGSLSFPIKNNLSSGMDEVSFAGGPNRAQQGKRAKIKNLKAARMEAHEQSEASKLEEQLTDIHTIYDEDKSKPKSWLEDQIIDLLNAHPKFDINTPIHADLEDKSVPKTPLLHFAVSRRLFRVVDYILNRSDLDLTCLGTPCFGSYKKPICIAQTAKLTAAYCKNRFGEEDDLTLQSADYADQIIKRQYEYEQSHPEQRTGYIRKNPFGQYILIGYDVEAKEYVDSDSGNDTKKPLNARHRRETANKKTGINVDALDGRGRKEKAVEQGIPTLPRFDEQIKPEQSFSKSEQEIFEALLARIESLLEFSARNQPKLLMDRSWEDWETGWEKVDYSHAAKHDHSKEPEKDRRHSTTSSKRSTSQTSRTGTFQRSSTAKSEQFHVDALKGSKPGEVWPSHADAVNQTSSGLSQDNSSWAAVASHERRKSDSKSGKRKPLPIKTQAAQWTPDTEANSLVSSPASSTFVPGVFSHATTWKTDTTEHTDFSELGSPHLPAIPDESDLFNSDSDTAQAKITPGRKKSYKVKLPTGPKIASQATQTVPPQDEQNEKTSAQSRTRRPRNSQKRRLSQQKKQQEKEKLLKEIAALKKQLQTSEGKLRTRNGQLRANQQILNSQARRLREPQIPSAQEAKKAQTDMIQAMVDYIAHKNELAKLESQYVQATEAMEEKQAYVDEQVKRKKNELRSLWTSFDLLAQNVRETLDERRNDPKYVSELPETLEALEKMGKQIQQEQKRTLALRDEYKQLSINPNDYVACSSTREPGWGYFVKPGLFSAGTWVPKLPGE